MSQPLDFDLENINSNGFQSHHFDTYSGNTFNYHFKLLLFHRLKLPIVFEITFLLL